MKLIRNLAFVVVGVVWILLGATPMDARNGEACNIRCDWGPSDCCNLGDLACGSEGGGQGLCYYCFGTFGEPGGSCSAPLEEGGAAIEGTVCQCESSK